MTDGKAGWGDEFGSDIDHINREGTTSAARSAVCHIAGAA
ncbi:uncharacterized protein FRV6_08574 [Fusarium oxysporum]|uniref:Uncharacterized protein n=1 Tax=Fusarium oxysporum TaxID=5507 RepID=A0A2H3T798_FUSOX|nr:uncharacterized protein FRV6_08574 [Fusarium oxysporum]